MRNHEKYIIGIFTTSPSGTSTAAMKKNIFIWSNIAMTSNNNDYEKNITVKRIINWKKNRKTEKQKLYIYLN